MMISATPLDRNFAEVMRQLDPSMDAAVARAACMVSHAVGDGHVCLDLSRWAGSEIEPGEFLPAFSAWKKVLFASAVVGHPGEFKPLIIDGERLYLARYWDYEKRLAENLLVRAGIFCGDVDMDRLSADLDRLFAHNTRQQSPDGQKAAVAIAVSRGLCIISGGPGTGKTSTVVRILAALQSQANGQLRIRLAAPTGKAAARMQDSVRKQKQGLDLPAAIIESIPEDASTLHRLLGSKPDSVYFRHDRDNPLVADVVVVDEASMIDLALLAKLVDALPAQARLILLGDKNQLAAVEAGAVFGDMCAGGGNSRLVRDSMRQPVKQVDLPAEEISPSPLNAVELRNFPFTLSLSKGEQKSQFPEIKPFMVRQAHHERLNSTALPSPLEDCIVLLKHSFRFRHDSGICELAHRIIEAEGSLSVAELLNGDQFSDIVWRRQFVLAELLERMELGYRAYFDLIAGGAGAGEVLAAFNCFRVLAAHYDGPNSASSTNRAFEAMIRAQRRVATYERWYAGRPVMVTQNDYGMRLFNGDIGVCLRAGEELRVYFEDAAGKQRSIAPARLPVHEPVYAMTVHKSQGSEFDEALLLLPESVSPVLNRPLIYTAVTRAKCRAEIWGSEEVLGAALGKAPERSSGLRERLWG